MLNLSKVRVCLVLNLSKVRVVHLVTTFHRFAVACLVLNLSRLEVVHSVCGAEPQ